MDNSNYAKKVELLSPAGDIEKLKFAFKYGADAVYLGAEEYGMRAAPKNFTIAQLKEAVGMAERLNKKVYLTLNTVPTNEEVSKMPQFVKKALQTGIHGVIVSDLGVMSIVREIDPDIEIHMSTQVGIANYAAANAAYKLGAKRVVLARELSFEDIINIRENTPKDLDIECFVHGAMCVSFSGRCLLSHYLTGRDANRGECAQPCRWEWQLSEKNRPGMFYDIKENTEGQGTYIMNANDLCMVQYIDTLINAGISNLKIEGRAKSFYYVASVTAAYRRAIDSYYEHPKNWVCPDFSLEEVTKTSHRNYSTGFYFDSKNAVQTLTDSSYIRHWDLLGVVKRAEGKKLFCEQRGKYNLGEEIEILTPNGQVFTATPTALFDESGKSILSTPHAMMSYVAVLKDELKVPEFSILRKKQICKSK
jgi:putative protease